VECGRSECGAAIALIFLRHFLAFGEGWTTRTADGVWVLPPGARERVARGLSGAHAGRFWSLPYTLPVRATCPHCEAEQLLDATSLGLVEIAEHIRTPGRDRMMVPLWRVEELSSIAGPAPVSDTYAAEAERVVNDVRGFVARTRDLLDLRAERAATKGGRVLSEANVGRLEGLLVELDTAATDVRALLDQSTGGRSALEAAMKAARQTLDTLTGDHP
jgi:hypothetical protein